MFFIFFIFYRLLSNLLNTAIFSNDLTLVSLNIEPHLIATSNKESFIDELLKSMIIELV
jgi:hypothetical protein